MKRTKMPPLGCKPLFILREERINELKAAICRYLSSNWPLPKEIIEEYDKLVEELEEEV